MCEHELEHKRTCHLHYGKHDGKHVFIRNAEIQDYGGNDHAHYGAHRIYDA